MKTRTAKITIDGRGCLLGREKGCLVVKDRKGKYDKYPIFENSISEISVRSGNLLSSGALATCAAWNIPVVIMTAYGNPIGVLRTLNEEDHAKTRIAQYEGLTNGKGLEIAKQIVLTKIKGQNLLLHKFGLKWLDYYPYSQAVKALEGTDLKLARNTLMSYEGKYSLQYFQQIFSLFNESFRPVRRKGFKAFDGLNNIFNIAYRVLAWKVHLAILKSKLDPFVGYLHSIQWGMPSLVCDFQDLYRYLVDDFLVGYCQSVRMSDFVLKDEKYAGNKTGKRQYLGDKKNRELVHSLDAYFESKVNIARIRRGHRQEIETLINEECLLLAQYLRNEKQNWIPRIASLTY